MITFLGSGESEREKGCVKVRERKERSGRRTWEDRVDIVELEKFCARQWYASVDRSTIRKPRVVDRLEHRTRDDLSALASGSESIAAMIYLFDENTVVIQG